MLSPYSSVHSKAHRCGKRQVEVDVFDVFRLTPSPRTRHSDEGSWASFKVPYCTISANGCRARCRVKANVTSMIRKATRSGVAKSTILESQDAASGRASNPPNNQKSWGTGSWSPQGSSVRLFLFRYLLFCCTGALVRWVHRLIYKARFSSSSGPLATMIAAASFDGAWV
jgi:hypothetical protein